MKFKVRFSNLYLLLTSLIFVAMMGAGVAIVGFSLVHAPNNYILLITGAIIMLLALLYIIFAFIGSYHVDEEKIIVRNVFLKSVIFLNSIEEVTLIKHDKTKFIYDRFRLRVAYTKENKKYRVELSPFKLYDFVDLLIAQKVKFSDEATIYESPELGPEQLGSVQESIIEKKNDNVYSINEKLDPLLNYRLTIDDLYIINPLAPFFHRVQVIDYPLVSSFLSTIARFDDDKPLSFYRGYYFPFNNLIRFSGKDKKNGFYRGHKNSQVGLVVAPEFSQLRTKFINHQNEALLDEDFCFSTNTPHKLYTYKCGALKKKTISMVNAITVGPVSGTIAARTETEEIKQVLDGAICFRVQKWINKTNSFRYRTIMAHDPESQISLFLELDAIGDQGASNNFMIQDGEFQKLGGINLFVSFNSDLYHSYMNPWRMQSPDRQIDLVFTPTKRARFDRASAAAETNSITYLGTLSGTINKQEIKIASANYVITIVKAFSL